LLRLYYGGRCILPAFLRLPVQAFLLFQRLTDIPKELAVKTAEQNRLEKTGILING